jgi:hypothetical protein
MELNVDDLQLNAKERHKFLLLCGPRYNETTGVVKMACTQFPFRAQNKEYLKDTLKKLLEEAKVVLRVFLCM